MSHADAVVQFAPESEASKAIEKIYQNLKRQIFNQYN
jgi:hypothetical protein